MSRHDDQRGLDETDLLGKAGVSAGEGFESSLRRGHLGDGAT
jgi:hypothetical protein